MVATTVVHEYEIDESTRLLASLTSRIDSPAARASFLVGHDHAGIESAALLLSRSWRDRDPMTRALFEREPRTVAADVLAVARVLVTEAARSGMAASLRDGAGRVVAVNLTRPLGRVRLDLPPSLAPIAQILDRLGAYFERLVAPRRVRPQVARMLFVPGDGAAGDASTATDLANANAARARLLGYREIITAVTNPDQHALARGSFETIFSLPYASCAAFAELAQKRDGDDRAPMRAKLMWRSL